MTSSNETSVNQVPKPDEWRKSRMFTWMAVGLAAITVAVFSILLFKVNVLETEYGEIRGNKARILREIESRKEEHTELLAEIQSLETDKFVLEGDLANARNLQQKLGILGEGISDAETTLKSMAAEKAEADRILMDRDAVKAELEKTRIEQVDLLGDKQRLNKEISRLQRDMETARDDTRDAKNTRDEVQDQVEDLQAKKRERDAVMGELITARGELKKANKASSESEASAEGAENRVSRAEDDLASLTDRISKARNELATNRNDASSEAAKLSGLQQVHKDLDARVEVLKTDEARMRQFIKMNAEAKADLTITTEALEKALEERTDVDAKIAAKREELEKEQAYVTEAKAGLAKLKQNLVGLEAEWQDAVEKREAVDANIQEKTQTHDSLSKQLTSVKAELASQTELLDQKRSARIAEENRLAGLQIKAAELGNVERELARMQPQLSTLEDAVKSAGTSLAALTGSVEAGRKRLEELRQNADRVSGELDNLRAEKSTLQNGLENLRSETANIEGLQQDQARLKGEITSLMAQKDVLASETDDARTALAQIDGKITVLKARLPALEQNEVDLNNQITEQENRRASLVEDIHDLERAKAALNSAQQETDATPTGASNEAPLVVETSGGEN